MARDYTSCPHSGRICVDPDCLTARCKSVYDRDKLCQDARIARLEADNERLREELEAERKRPLMLWFAENAEEPISEDDIADALGSPEVAEMWMARQLPSEWVAVHPGEEEDWLSWHETEDAARAALNADADKAEGGEK